METVIVKPDVEMDSNMNIVTDTVSMDSNLNIVTDTVSNVYIY